MSFQVRVSTTSSGRSSPALPGPRPSSQSRVVSRPPSRPHRKSTTVLGFTTLGAPQNHGVTGFKTVNTQWVPETSGTATLSFDVFDRGDTIFDSAALVDAAAVGQDPPLYFLRRGDSLVRTGTDPLLRLNNATQTFDSLMVVCCDGRATLAGPLLHATDSNLTVPWSLLAVMQGGRPDHVLDRPARPPRRGRLHLRRRGRPDVRSLRHDRGDGSGDRPHARHPPPPRARGLAPRRLQRHRDRRSGRARGQRPARGQRAAPRAPQRQQADHGGRHRPALLPGQGHEPRLGGGARSQRAHGRPAAPRSASRAAACSVSPAISSA